MISGWKPCSNGHFAGSSPKYTVSSLALWSCHEFVEMAKIYWSHYQEKYREEGKNVKNEYIGGETYNSIAKSFQIFYVGLGFSHKFF